MASHNKDGPQYPAHEGAKISGDHPLSMATQGAQSGSATCVPVLDVAQGVPGRSATCDTVSPTGIPPTREEAGSVIPPARRRGEGKQAGCGASAKRKTQVSLTEHSAKSLVTSGSKSSITEADMDNPQAGCGAPASTQVVTNVEMEEMFGDYSPPSESIDDDTLLKSPLGATASDTPAPCVSTGATASKSSRPTNRKRKPEAGPTPPQGSKKKKKSKRGPRLATFEQAAKEDLLGVVLVQDNPYQILTKDQIAWLLTTLGNRVDAVIDSDAEFIPRFTESGVCNGRFCLSCANEESFSWLASLMDTLEGTDGKVARSDFGWYYQRIYLSSLERKYI